MGSDEVRHDVEGEDDEVLNLDSEKTNVIRLCAREIELEDLCFNENSAVFLPPRGTALAEDDQDEIVGLGALAEVLRFAQENPEKRLLIAAHTDVTSEDEHNRELSEDRAKAVYTFLRGEKTEWAQICMRRHVTKDWQAILEWVAFTRGWFCGPEKAGLYALGIFRDRYSKEVAPLKTTDKNKPELEDWEAFYTLYDEDLRMLLGVSETELRFSYRGQLNFTSPRAVGCGERWPLDDPAVMSRANRRVELLFFDPNEAPKLVCHLGGDPKKCPVYKNKRSRYKSEHLHQDQALSLNLKNLEKEIDEAARENAHFEHYYKELEKLKRDLVWLRDNQPEEGAQAATERLKARAKRIGSLYHELSLQNRESAEIADETMWINIGLGVAHVAVIGGEIVKIYLALQWATADVIGATAYDSLVVQVKSEHKTLNDAFGTAKGLWEAAKKEDGPRGAFWAVQGEFLAVGKLLSVKELDKFADVMGNVMGAFDSFVGIDEDGPEKLPEKWLSYEGFKHLLDLAGDALGAIEGVMGAVDPLINANPAFEKAYKVLGKVVNIIKAAIEAFDAAVQAYESLELSRMHRERCLRFYGGDPSTNEVKAPSRGEETSLRAQADAVRSLDNWAEAEDLISKLDRRQSEMNIRVGRLKRKEEAVREYLKSLEPFADNLLGRSDKMEPRVRDLRRKSPYIGAQDARVARNGANRLIEQQIRMVNNVYRLEQDAVQLGAKGADGG